MVERIQKRRPAISTDEEGFSLIEVAVSVAILLIGILAIATGEIQSFTMNRKSAEALKAVSAVENMIEMIRRNPEGVDEYHKMNTSSARNAGLLLTMAEADFNRWKTDIQAIASAETGTTTEVFLCGAVSVRGPCGSIQVNDGLVDDVKTVIVQVVWPSRKNGITMTSTVTALSES